MTTAQMYAILDTIFKSLYMHSDRDGLDLEKDILKPHRIKLTPLEIDRLRDVLLASGLADSIIGFGRGGKLEITPAGLQMMTRYGSYQNFLLTQQSGSQAPAQQLTIQLVNPEEEKPPKDKKPALAPVKAPKPTRTKPVRKPKPSK
jgi:hypothetical protein